MILDDNIHVMFYAHYHHNMLEECSAERAVAAKVGWVADVRVESRVEGVLQYLSRI